MGDGTISVADAGRRGGLATSARYGRDHFSMLGSLAPAKPAAFYARIAPLGGAATKAKFKSPHFQAIGRLGGLSVLAHYGKEHYVEAGRKGAAVKAARRAAARTPHYAGPREGDAVGKP